jgi:hypothetical protein
MPGRARTQPLSPPDRLVGWLVTGPLGHLAGFAIDAAIAWTGWARGAVGQRWSVRRRRDWRSQSSKR